MNQLSFFEEVQEPQLETRLFVPSCADRSWCSPSTATHIVGLDCGKGGSLFAFWLDPERPEVVKGDVLAWFRKLPKHTLVVVEHAHMATPRTKKSLAQPFTAEQLLEIYRICESGSINLLMLPHHHTKKCREWAANNFPNVEGEKSDENDARAFAHYVGHCNGLSLVKPHERFCADLTCGHGDCRRRRFGEAVIAQSNIMLNAERTYKYSGEHFPDLVLLADRFIKHAKANDLPFFKETMHAFSVLSLICTVSEGVVVAYGSGGKRPGFDMWRRHVLKFTPSHHTAGIARSNINHHRFRTYLDEFAASLLVFMKELKPDKKSETLIPFGRHTPEQDAVRRACWKDVRHQMREAYFYFVRQTQDCRVVDPRELS